MPQPPAEYERFFYTRLFWQTLGRHYDDMTRNEVQEAQAFLSLEQRHPQRFERKDK